MSTKKLTILLSSIIFFSFTVSPVTAGQIDDVSIQKTTTGETKTITISLSASNIGGITIEGLPNGWTIQNHTDDGAIFVQDDGNNDGHNERMGWAWPEQQSQTTVSATIQTPQTVQPGNYNLTTTTRNGGQTTDTITITISDQNQDRDQNQTENTNNQTNQDTNQTQQNQQDDNQQQPGFTVLTALISIITIAILAKKIN